MILKTLNVIVAVIMLIYGIGAFFVIPQFENLFISFDAELPLITKLIFYSYRFWLALIIIPVFIHIKYITKTEISHEMKSRLIIILSLALPFLLLFLAVITYAMYAPIFELEAVSK